MKRIITLSFFILCIFTIRAFPQGVKNGDEGGTGVRNGSPAPEFTAKDQNGKTVSLSQFKGKKVVLYFYPKDDTQGCTQEACSLRDNYDSLTKAGYVILGVSGDDEKSHKNFQTKYNLPFTLVADVDKSIRNEYGAWVEKEKDGQKVMAPARVTYIIDEKGVVQNRIEQVDTKQHAHQILSLH